MMSLENLFSCAPTCLENPRQKWRLAVYVINNHALLKNQILWEARHTFKSLTKLNKSILSILQAMKSYKYYRNTNLFHSAQLKGGSVVVYSWFVVGPIDCWVLC